MKHQQPPTLLPPTYSWYELTLMTDLSKMGENEAISRLSRKLQPAPAGVVGIGDDTAVVPVPRAPDAQQILTSDAVIEGRHYFPETDPLRVGRKAVNRVLSDIAAMGGTPSYLLVNVVAPPTCDMDWLDRAYEGMDAATTAFNATILGGDLTPGPLVEFHVFGVGEVPSSGAILRSGACPTDVIMVTGTLGGSLQGKHLDFTPRIEQGQFLRTWATAMMDLSDGLAMDLHRMCMKSGTGALVHLPKLPVDPAVHALENTSLKPWEHILFDGEDYELLFTIPSDCASDFMTAWKEQFELRCTPVGIMTKEAGIIKLLNDDEQETPLTDEMMKDYGLQAFHKDAP